VTRILVTPLAQRGVLSLERTGEDDTLVCHPDDRDLARYLLGERDGSAVVASKAE